MIRNTHVVMLTSALRMIPLSIGRLWVQKMSIIFGGTRSVPQGPKKNEQFSEGALPAGSLKWIQVCGSEPSKNKTNHKFGVYHFS